MTGFIEKALAIAARGVPVFPCGQNKAPLAAGGFKSASQDPERIKAWGRKHPGALVGMPTGHKTFVLDVDTGPAHSADGFDTMAQHGWELPATRTHHTRSGGRHVFFALPDGVTMKSRAGIAPGLDIRAEGGYVIRWDAEGCPVENPRILATPPAWLLDALTATPAPVHRQASYPAASLPPALAGIDNADLWAGCYQPLAHSRAIALLAAICPDCPYDEWVRVGLALHHEMGPEGLRYWAAWSSRGQTYPGPEALARKWSSFTGRPGAAVTAGTLVALAKQNKEIAHAAR